MNAPITLPHTSTLDMLSPREIAEALDAIDQHPHAIYSEVLDACKITQAPSLRIAAQGWTPEHGGKAGEYHRPRHTITIDSAFILHVDRARLESVLAHELAHAIHPTMRHDAGMEGWESEIIARLNEREGRARVEQLPHQTGWTPQTKRILIAWGCVLGAMITTTALMIARM